MCVSVLVVARWLKPDFDTNTNFIRDHLGDDYQPLMCPWTGADWRGLFVVASTRVHPEQVPLINFAGRCCGRVRRSHVVEPRGIEPLTSALQKQRSTN